MKRLSILILITCFFWACGTKYQPSESNLGSSTESQEDKDTQKNHVPVIADKVEPQKKPDEEAGRTDIRSRQSVNNNEKEENMVSQILSRSEDKATVPAAGEIMEQAERSGAFLGGKAISDGTMSSGAGAGDVAEQGGRKVKRALAVVPHSIAAPARGAIHRPEELVPAPYNREGYKPVYENQFMEVVQNPLSTFSIDVDAASYSNMRRFVNNHQLPPKDAVRIEEMVNYFNYDYPQPGGNRPFSITTEVSTTPWHPLHRLVHVGIQGKKINNADLPPSNLVFLLDVSGSMNAPNKLPLLKSAFRLLVQQMRPQDRVAIVVYAGAAGTVLPSTPGSRKDEILQVLDNLRAGGSTAGGAGINLAYSIAGQHFKSEGNNRVILATDGDFNVGISSEAGLVRLIEEKRKTGIYLTVLGFGSGNYQDAKMEQLADKGNGNYAYIDNVREARKVLVNEMGSTLVTIAKDVKIQVEFNPAHVKAYRLIGYENRMMAKEDFNNDKKDAGELGAGHTVTALYEVIPPGVDIPDIDVDPLKYQSTRIRPDAYRNPELMTVKLRYKKPDGHKSRLIERPVFDGDISLEQTSDNFRFSSAVAAFGLLLRDSEFRGNTSYAQVLRLARASTGVDQHGYRAEFVGLVESCALLTPHARIEHVNPEPYR